VKYSNETHFGKCESVHHSTKGWIKGKKEEEDQYVNSRNETHFGKCDLVHHPNKGWIKVMKEEEDEHFEVRGHL
jgi:hypothetical protein